jgi:hypothetical protein
MLRIPTCPQLEGTIMASAAQVKANRENCRFSTGPRTEEGKNISRLNAVTHGYYAKITVVPGEKLEEWQAFCVDYVQEKFAEGLPEILCAAQSALAEWMLLRLNTSQVKAFVEKSPDEVPRDDRYVYLDERREKQEERIENHLIRIRDKHLAQLRLHKKDRAGAAKESNGPMTMCQLESVAATIPVAVQPDPIVDATSPIGAQTPETASHSPEELARREAIREETVKFIAYLNTRRPGLSEEEISQEIDNHLKEIGLVVDSPQVEAN